MKDFDFEFTNWIGKELGEKLSIDASDVDSAIGQFYSMVSDEQWGEFSERFEKEIQKAKFHTLSPKEASALRRVHKLDFKSDPLPYTKEEPQDLDASIVLRFGGHGYVLDGQHRINRAIKAGKSADTAWIDGDWMEDFGVTTDKLNARFKVVGEVTMHDLLKVRGDSSFEASDYRAKNKRIIKRGGGGKFRKTTLADIGVGICDTCGKPYSYDPEAVKSGPFIDPMKMAQHKKTCADCMKKAHESLVPEPTWNGID